MLHGFEFRRRWTNDVVSGTIGAFSKFWETRSLVVQVDSLAIISLVPMYETSLIGLLWFGF